VIPKTARRHLQVHLFEAVPTRASGIPLHRPRTRGPDAQDTAAPAPNTASNTFRAPRTLRQRGIHLVAWAPPVSRSG
jgi:hypothetical protein